MRHAAGAKERARARMGAVDELIDQHEGRAATPSLNDPQAESETRSVTPARLSASILAR
jgi:hypothetical protein